MRQKLQVAMQKVPCWPHNLAISLRKLLKLTPKSALGPKLSAKFHYEAEIASGHAKSALLAT
jgi:hypothetical protein